MFERELTLFKFNVKYLRMLAADMDDAQLTMIAYPGANPPVWILGHIAVTMDFAGRMLGLPVECPRAWHKQFAPGTNPANVESPLPTKEELLTSIENGHRRVSEAAPGASADVMNAPHAVEILKPTVIKTNGDVMAHLMTTHFSFHLAQLSACRRSAGKGPIV